MKWQTKLVKNFGLKGFTENKPWHSFWLLSKTVSVGVVLLFLLLLPQTLTFADQVSAKLGQFSTATLDGTFEAANPIVIPSQQPWLVIDLHDQLKQGNEEIRVTNDTVFVLGKSITIDELRDMKANRDRIATVFAPLALIVLLGVVVGVGIVFWIKYVVLAIILALLGWEILDLTHFRQPFGVVFSTSMHASAVMVFVELLLLPFVSEYLYPFFTYWRLSVYALPLLVYVIVFSLAIGLKIKCEKLKN